MVKYHSAVHSQQASLCQPSHPAPQQQAMLQAPPVNLAKQVNPAKQEGKHQPLPHLSLPHLNQPQKASKANWQPHPSPPLRKRTPSSHRPLPRRTSWQTTSTPVRASTFQTLLHPSLK